MEDQRRNSNRNIISARFSRITSNWTIFLHYPMARSILAPIILGLLCTSSLTHTASAQALDPEQPSPINNLLHFWGNEELSDCWESFDGDGSGGSADQGYGEEVDGGDAERLEVDVTCRMKYDFDENVYLKAGMRITLEFGLRIDHADAESEEDEDLTITLMKGSEVVDSRSFPDIATDQDIQLKWELDIIENSTWWNSSQGEPSVRFQISKMGWDASGTPCSGPLQMLKCGGFFRVYYSNNQEGMRTQILFPIGEAPEVVIEEEPEEEGLPGFGLMTGLSAMAMAVIAPRRGPQTPRQ